MALRLTAFLALLSLAACATPPVLYTDEFFRAAAPEILRAWQNPGWFRATRTVDLPLGGGLGALRQALDQDRPTGGVLVGVLLSPTDRRDLTAQHPKTTMHFLTASQGDGAASTIFVNRSEAWALVARHEAARGSDGGTAFALFPSNASSDEIRSFEEAWRKAGGGALSTATGPRLAAPTPLPEQVFQWAGGEGEALALSLPPSVLVHGNPGTLRVSGAQGTTWRLRESDLATFLWDAAQSRSTEPQFLPLETVVE